jgi:nitroimidazol reductase NimA-like FMN-containing flavoprotein (pyridoxamine 5'-phosphate oxidase superfamily)
MIGIMGSFTSPNTPLDLTSRPLDLYLHGHSSSRFMRQSADPVDNEGIPICVCATHVDGLVLALSPFNHSMNYRSAVIHGYANVVTEDAEKIYAMTLITDKLIPDRWVNSRNPPFKSEMQSTAILKVTVISASAKVRVGGPSDDRKDEANREVRGKIWTGVVPMHTILGEPVPSETNELPLPADLKNWIEKVNEDGKKYAFGATSKVAGK